MSESLLKYKGIHPGLVLARELEKKNLKQRPLAQKINCHPQALNAICKGKRKIPTLMALKIEGQLGLHEGDLSLLQTYFDIAQLKSKLEPDKIAPPNLRKSLFWDTDFSKIRWKDQYVAVIRRVLERGNTSEIESIKSYYGPDKVKAIAQKFELQSKAR